MVSKMWLISTPCKYHVILRMRNCQWAICIANSSQSVNIITTDGLRTLKFDAGLDCMTKDFREPFKVKRSIVKVRM